MATTSTNFRRTQSKVWWSNDFSERPYYDDVAMTIATSGIELTTTVTPKTPEMQQNASWINRQGSPSSHKSQVNKIFNCHIFYLSFIIKWLLLFIILFNRTQVSQTVKHHPNHN